MVSLSFDTIPLSHAFRLFDHILQNDFRVMVSRVSDGFLPILNCLLRAPLNTGEALFTPNRFHSYCICRLPRISYPWWEQIETTFYRSMKKECSAREVLCLLLSAPPGICPEQLISTFSGPPRIVAAGSQSVRGHPRGCNWRAGQWNNLK